MNRRKQQPAVPEREWTAEEAGRWLSNVGARSMIATGEHLEERPYLPVTDRSRAWYPFLFEVRIGLGPGEWKHWWDFETRQAAEAAWPAIQAEWPHCPYSELVDWRVSEDVLEVRDCRPQTETPTTDMVSASVA